MGDLNARIGCDQDFGNIANDLDGHPELSGNHNPFGIKTSQDTIPSNKREKIFVCVKISTYQQNDW